MRLVPLLILLQLTDQGHVFGKNSTINRISSNLTIVEYPRERKQATQLRESILAETAAVYFITAPIRTTLRCRQVSSRGLPLPLLMPAVSTAGTCSNVTADRKHGWPLAACWKIRYPLTYYAFYFIKGGGSLSSAPRSLFLSHLFPFVLFLSRSVCVCSTWSLFALALL